MAERKNGEAEPDGPDDGIKNRIRSLAAQAVSMGLTMSPTDLARKISKETGIKDEKWVQYTSVELVNRVNSDLYSRTSKSGISLLTTSLIREMVDAKLIERVLEESMKEPIAKAAAVGRKLLEGELRKVARLKFKKASDLDVKVLAAETQAKTNAANANDPAKPNVTVIAGSLPA